MLKKPTTFSAPEHAVNIQFEELVQLVDGLLDLLAQSVDLLKVVGVGVDHDRVGVAVDDVEVHFLDEVPGVEEDLPTLAGHHGRQMFGVEPEIF